MKNSSSKKKWLYVTIGGILMIIFSIALLGNAIYVLAVPSFNFWSFAFSSSSGVASLITGILMLFDAAKERVLYYVKNSIKKQEGKYTKESDKKIAYKEDEYINSLSEKTKSLRPEQTKE